MSTPTHKQVEVGGVELGAALAEAAAFAPSKFSGFEDLARRIGVLAGRNLSFGEGLELELTYSEAEAVTPDFILSSGLEKNLNFALKLAPFATPGILSVARPVFYSWLEIALGGARNAETVYPDRDPTELELQIGRLLCKRFCDTLFAAFRGVAAVTHIHIVAPTAEEAFGNWVRRDSQFAICYEASLGQVSGEVVLCLPLRMIDTMRSQAAPVGEDGEADAELVDPAWDAMLRSSVETTRLNMVAVLGRRQMTLGELSDMEVGQLIVLGKPTREPILVEAGDRPVFSAVLGRSNGRYMLKFEHMADDATEGSDGFLA